MANLEVQKEMGGAALVCSCVLVIWRGIVQKSQEKKIQLG